MSVSEDLAEPSAAPPRVRGRTVALAIAAVVVLVGGGWSFVHWRDGLRLYPSAGDEVSADQAAVGRTFYAPEVWSPAGGPRSLELTAATPAVRINTAHAEVRTLSCTVKAGLTTFFGADWSLRQWCATVRPFAPGRYRLSGTSVTGGAVVLVVAITPHAPGHVHVAGVRLQYEQGMRRGDQLVGIEVDNRTK